MCAYSHFVLQVFHLYEGVYMAGSCVVISRQNVAVPPRAAPGIDYVAAVSALEATPADP